MAPGSAVTADSTSAADAAVNDPAVSTNGSDHRRRERAAEAASATTVRRRRCVSSGDKSEVSARSASSNRSFQ